MTLGATNLPVLRRVASCRIRFVHSAPYTLDANDARFLVGVVETMGLEPTTSWLQTRRSTS